MRAQRGKGKGKGKGDKGKSKGSKGGKGNWAAGKGGGSLGPRSRLRRAVWQGSDLIGESRVNTVCALCHTMKEGCSACLA